MRTSWNRLIYALVMLLALTYGYDYASVRRRMSAQRAGDPFDVVTYPHLLAIPQKGNKVDYELDAQTPMESESCVHSLFPHYGYTPCWYVLRKSKNPTQMMIVFPWVAQALLPVRFCRFSTKRGSAQSAKTAQPGVAVLLQLRGLKNPR